jgi:tetratricopeptide (TPR) repeat protein
MESAEHGKVLRVRLSGNRNKCDKKKTAEVPHSELIIIRMLDTRGLDFARRTRLIFLAGCLAALAPMPLRAQDRNPIQLAQEAVTVTEQLEAIEALTAEIESNPSADAYLYLGLAHSGLEQYERALELFEEADARYPNDTRFLAETAGIHVAERDFDAAIEALERALRVDPLDLYAADLLASIHLSEGGVERALDIWNDLDQPVIDNIFQNFSPGFLDRAVPQALTFGSGDILTYDQWRTSQVRLIASHLYSNVGLEIEPSPEPDRYNAIIRTTARTNRRNGFLIGLVKGLPIETMYLDMNNVGDLGIGWRSSYRWDSDRRRLQGRVIVPLPLPGLPVVEFYDSWRRERWDISNPLRPGITSDPRFDYKVNTVGLDFHAIPHYQAEVRAGFEYRNRDVTGPIAGLGMDDRNSATLKFGTTLRPLNGRYKNQIIADGFIARKTLLGDFDFSGGTVQIANRLELNDSARTTLDFSLTGGTSRGEVPVDHYFILGLGSVAQHQLRGHVTSERGQYGKAPMGTDFVLVNTDIKHRLLTIPLFDSFGIPFIEVKAMAFYDTAKVFDRQRIFSQNEWSHDVGAGIRFETPTTSFTALYGRDTTGGENTFYAYFEQRFW